MPAALARDATIARTFLTQVERVTSAADEALRRLETQLGPLHARLRLGMEREHEAQAFGQGLSFLHLENLPLMQAMIEIALRVTGTYFCAPTISTALREPDTKARLSAGEPPPPGPLCKPLGPPAPLVAVPLEVVQGLTQLLVAGPDPAKELLNV